MQSDDPSKMKQVKRARDITPTQGLEKANITGSSFASLSKALEIPGMSLENQKKSHTRNTSLQNSSSVQSSALSKKVEFQKAA